MTLRQREIRGEDDAGHAPTLVRRSRRGGFVRQANESRGTRITG